MFQIDAYIKANSVEKVLDATDMYTREHLERITHEEVFNGLREKVNGRLVQSHV